MCVTVVNIPEDDETKKAFYVSRRMSAAIRVVCRCICACIALQCVLRLYGSPYHRYAIWTLLNAVYTLALLPCSNETWGSICNYFKENQYKHE